MRCFAADPQLSRPVRTWEFLDATGPHAGLLGAEDGTLEAYVYPLKIFGGMKLRFVTGGQIIPGESIARRIASRPGSYTITYTGDDFQADETLVAPIDEPGAAILLDVRARNPVRIDVEFVDEVAMVRTGKPPSARVTPSGTAGLRAFSSEPTASRTRPSSARPMRRSNRVSTRPTIRRPRTPYSPSARSRAVRNASWRWPLP